MITPLMRLRLLVASIFEHIACLSAGRIVDRLATGQAETDNWSLGLVNLVLSRGQQHGRVDGRCVRRSIGSPQPFLTQIRILHPAGAYLYCIAAGYAKLGKIVRHRKRRAE
jgi:hypothetical protein